MKLPPPIQSILKSAGWYGDTLLQLVEISSEEEVYHWMLVQKLEEQVQILSVSHSLSSDQLLVLIDQYNSIPIAIGIHQAQAVEALVNEKEPELVKAVLGVSVEDRMSFLYQEFPPLHGKKLVSIVRKSQLEEWMQPFVRVQDRIIFINVSTASLAYLLPGMGNYEEKQSYCLANRWHGYGWAKGLGPVEEKSTQLIDEVELAGQLAIEVHSLYLFATGVQYYLSEGKALAGWENSWENRTSILQQQRTSRILLTLLPVLIVLNLIIGGGYLWLQLKNENSQQQLYLKATTLSKIREQQRKINRQSRFLQQASQEILAPSRVSYYLDRFASFKPEGLRFQTISINPTQKEWDKLVGEVSNQLPDIYLKGSANEPQAITAFAHSLEDAEFIQNAQLYRTEYEFQEQRHHFVLTISPKILSHETPLQQSSHIHAAIQ